MATVLVKDYLNAKIIAVDPDAPLLKAIDILLKNGFDGLPVVDSQGNVLGALTDRDLTFQGSVHLPTFLKLLQEFHVYSKDLKAVRPDVEKILNLRVKDAMNSSVPVIKSDAALEEAWKLFNANPELTFLIGVDDFGKLAGVLARRDLIKFFGSPSVVKNIGNHQELEKNVAKFLKDFESQFILVNRFHTLHWVLVSMLFTLVGFLVAFALIVRFR